MCIFLLVSPHNEILSVSVLEAWDALKTPPVYQFINQSAPVNAGYYGRISSVHAGSCLAWEPCLLSGCFNSHLIISSALLLDFILIFKSLIYSYVWEADLHTHTKRESYFPKWPNTSLSNCQQWPRMGQVEAENLEFNPESSVSWVVGAQFLKPSLWLPRICLRSALLGDRVGNGTQMHKWGTQMLPLLG